MHISKPPENCFLSPATSRILPWSSTLVPSNFEEKLLVRPDLIQKAQQFHLRPFNGHHAQVPITDDTGELTQEVEDWLPFARATSCLLARGQPRKQSRDLRLS